LHEPIRRTQRRSPETSETILTSAMTLRQGPSRARARARARTRTRNRHRARARARTDYRAVVRMRWLAFDHAPKHRYDTLQKLACLPRPRWDLSAFERPAYRGKPHTRAPSLERCPGGYQEGAAVCSRAFSVSFCDVVRAGPARLVQVFGCNRSGERPAPLSCQDAHFSKNSQEGGKFGRKSYENLLPVFSPSCKFWQFFRGFTRERLRLVALVRLFFSNPSSRSPTPLLNRTARRYTSSFS
jgi:hypothetical protein